MKKPIPILLLAIFFAWSGISGVWHYMPLDKTIAGMGRLETLFFWLYWKQFFVIPIYLVLAYGLWARKEWGRILAVIYFGLNLISTVLGAVAILGSHFKGNFPRSIGFPMVIQFGILTYLALILFYLTHRQTRQYFQGSVSDDNEISKNTSWAGYTGVLLLLCLTYFPYLWANTARMLSAGKDQTSRIAALERRSYPPLADLEKEAALKPGVPDLPRMAMSAYVEGQYDKAKKYAEELLQLKSESWTERMAIHDGNIILGRLALRRGDVEEAKARLLAAGKAPGSPPLVTFSPNMILAEELLEKNERTVVLQYFGLCRGFWTRGQSELDAWTADVQKGKIPDFEGHLIYW